MIDNTIHAPMFDIRRFCAPADEPSQLAPSFPFQDEGMLIASNASITVAIPCQEAHHPHATEHLRGILSRLGAMPRTEPVVDVASLQLPGPQPCLYCQGVGRVLVEDCEGCEGLGQFAHGGSTYRCAVCAGRGEVFEVLRNAQEPGRRCWYCFGSGAQHVAVPVGPALYEASHLVMLSDLPNCQLQPAVGDVPGRFTFDGGWGFVNPTVTQADMRLLSVAYEMGFARSAGIAVKVSAEQP